MARIHAFVRLDPARAPEQTDFLRSRVTVLREAGGQFFVAMEDAQVDTFVSQGFSVSVFPDADVLELGPLSYRPASETPQPPEALRASAPAGDALAFWVVHFVAPPDKAWLQQIALAGAEQVHVLGPSAGAFRASSAAADAVKSLPYVDSVALFHPAFAVSPDLAGIAEPLDASTLAQLAVHLPPSDPQGNLELQVFDALDPDDVRPALAAAGATIVGGAPHGFRLQATAETINAILAVPGVFSASTPVSLALAVHNAGVIVGANEVRNLGTTNFLVNLDGAGEIGAAVDTGFDVGLLEGLEAGDGLPGFEFHRDLVTNIRLIRHSATPEVTNRGVPDQLIYGTLVAGIIVGDGTASGGRIRGYRSTRRPHRAGTDPGRRQPDHRVLLRCRAWCAGREQLLGLAQGAAEREPLLDPKQPNRRSLVLRQSRRPGRFRRRQ